MAFEVLKKIDKKLFVVALIHYIITLVYPFSKHIEWFDQMQTVVFILVKIFAFILIVIFWQLISLAIKKYKEKDEQAICFIRFTMFYWALNLLIAYFTYPTRDYFSNPYLPDFSYYFVGRFCNVLSDFIPILNYNIIPVDYSSAICSTFVYSLIFAYVINGIKNNISSKYYFFAILPFCLPLILIHNLLISRLIYSAWLFVYICFYMLFNINKQNNNSFWVVWFALLCGVLASFRMEYIFLVIIIPCSFFIYKYFNLKKFILFSMIFFVTFLGIYKINTPDKEFRQDYILDNLINNYILYQKAPFYNLSDEDYHTLKKVFLSLDYIVPSNENITEYIENIDNSNTENNYKAIYVLTKILIKHPWFFIQEKINGINYLLKYSNDVFEFLIFKIPLYNKKNDSNLSFILYVSNNFQLNKFLQIIYNPILNYIMLFLVFVYGLFVKKSFYIFWGLFWIFISFIVLFTMPYIRYLYYLPEILNSWILFFTILIEICNKKCNQYPKK